MLMCTFYGAFKGHVVGFCSGSDKQVEVIYRSALPAQSYFFFSSASLSSSHLPQTAFRNCSVLALSSMSALRSLAFSLDDSLSVRNFVAHAISSTDNDLSIFSSRLLCNVIAVPILRYFLCMCCKCNKKIPLWQGHNEISAKPKYKEAPPLSK